MSGTKQLKTHKAHTQYFHMAVTKLGAKLMCLEKRALFGLGKKQPAPPPTLRQRVGRGMGLAGSFAMPGLMAFGAANSVASGENSLGGSLGELGGGLSGWSLGEHLGKSVTKNIKSKFLKGPLRLGASLGLGLAGSFMGGTIGSGMGNSILPFRRKPPAYEAWLNETAAGWNGQT